MPGTLPPTRLLVTKNDRVIGVFDKYVHVAHAIDCDVTDDGVVTLRGRKQNPTYFYDPSGRDPNAFQSKDAIMADWVRCYLRDPSIRVYRYLT